MMLRFCLIALMTAVSVLPAAADPLPIEFLPPSIAPRNVCNAPPPGNGDINTEQGLGEIELTDELRVEFIKRDIRRLQREDAGRWFDFIDALIAWQGRLDPEFSEIDQRVARITLHLRARRMADLEARALIPQLRARIGDLTNNQKLILARYYTDGVGVPVDTEFAKDMIREAAFGGNARALAQIARLLAQGETLDGWDAPLDLTITMAFGGLLGELNPGVCARAERIAQEYIKGDLVIANPEIAKAWRKFAADMGGAQAAWRVVEYHLNADGDQKDLDEMRHYLARARELGVAPDDRQTSLLLASGAITDKDLQDILGFNYDQDRRRVHRSLIPYLELGLKINGLVINEDSLRLQYLREQALIPNAPGFVFTNLAKELIERQGRWKAEPEVLDLLEEAVRRGDEHGMQMLAQMLVRYRDDPKQFNRSENLLLETVERFGMMSSIDRLDTLYRCQANDAPMLPEATHWSETYAATMDEPVTLSAGDALTLSPFRSPERLARLQTHALQGRTQARAEMGQRMQSDPLTADRALRLWAKRISASDKALETFGRMELDLAQSPAEWELAIEFFRRVYLNNGVTTALDLSVALTDDMAREAQNAKDMLHMLTMAGVRGEGASIRLKARLLAKSTSAADYMESARLVYDEFKQVIEERGDFLALMFAIPFLPEDKVDDYIDRAVSLMNCGNKDADEVSDAYAIRGDAEMAQHWRNIILHFDGGHILSKLRLTDEQMEMFNQGAAPNAEEVMTRSLNDGDPVAQMRLYHLTANPDLPSFDPKRAAGLLGAMLKRARGQDLITRLHMFRIAHASVRQAVSDELDMTAVFLGAAEAGDARARLEYALALKARAETGEDLAQVAKWMRAAAEGGQSDAMVELGFALGFGLGVPRDPREALEWLSRAESARNPRAAELARLISASNR
ncbi:tetratricopeptide repeat protein [Pacificoceanicola onchidii]|uniref:tetratricopeptide repeat protein n=1 Tax=Pacificoceanicola onchidii TaxID=2562685 RepID=UPI0010A36CE2|nr:SEL1-like repeat protein [Pacificoceanicola onchidii]